MTTPIFSVTAAILYFGWLWHGRSAADRSKGGSLIRPVKKSNRTGEIHALRLAPVESVIAKPFNLKNASTPVAHGVAQ